MLQVQEQQAGPFNVGMPGATIPMGMRILAIALRALFIGAPPTVLLSRRDGELKRSSHPISPRCSNEPACDTSGLSCDWQTDS